MSSMPLNKNLHFVREATSIAINQQVYNKKHQGERVITLSLGEAYFDIPDFGFDAINFKQGYHYSDTAGLPALRQKLAAHYSNQFNIHSIDADKNIIISAGSKLLTYLSMLAILNHGDEVLLHEPAWLSYQDQASLCGAETRYIPYHVKAENFRQYFSENTKLLIINNPNNPAGWIYDKHELVQLIKLAEQSGIYVLFDEAYSDFVANTEHFHSASYYIADFDNVIVVNSMSKNFGMSGWRVGFLVATPHLVQHILKLNQHIITCAPTPLQMYFAEHFTQIYHSCQQQINALMVKRQQVANLLEQHQLKPLSGNATFYFFIDISQSSMSSKQLCKTLLEHFNIALVPGSAYGHSTNGFIRLSFGTEPLTDIEYAIKTIASFCSGEQE
ncbi:pyridoxal phosphate-dependent aminotransferase [Parashewanella spongiae]|uniref:Aminotransferase n=1 Tax=Parashewanella spongiae TaxID=342950 RepID=A0A3A6U5K9_9GAMM|nr:pyridoxal phosphate-dependent aminotransferase [Parashewanella spongiae]MCL1076772.1 pyridoxal phosphate-dependent aminotransferase [Parashewanella spongiae]RJY19303.1 pyridoxal phosphate-dependent aminotransferase [Parashewanella spongiae]